MFFCPVYQLLPFLPKVIYSNWEITAFGLKCSVHAEKSYYLNNGHTKPPFVIKLVYTCGTRRLHYGKMIILNLKHALPHYRNVFCSVPSSPRLI